MPQAETHHERIARLLRDTMKNRKISVSELGRRLAKRNGSKAMSWRRLLQKYRAGEVLPEDETALWLAEELGVPEETFVSPRAPRPSRDANLWAAISDLREQLERLRKSLERP